MSEYTNAAYQINDWLTSAPEKVGLVKSVAKDMDSMEKLHVHDGSYLGEIVGNYSKVTLCDGYFILLCGMGDNSIVDINALNKKGMPELFPGALIIAYDINGNIFALNSGACKDADMGSILYLPNESFAWENLNISYAQFLKWISNVKISDLVKNGWRAERKDKVVGNISEYLIGKAVAYYLFLRQGR